MEKIKDIYTNDDYYPFILYCDNHGYTDMSDLTKCEFRKLQSESDITPRLLSKIKIIYVSYCKKHSDEFTAVKKPVQSAKSSQAGQEIQKQLELYFQKNEGKLIHITDVLKEVGKKYKRNDIIKMLNEASWCKAVDDTTFFYTTE